MEALLKRLVPMRLLYWLLNAYLFFDRRERFAVTGFIFNGSDLLLVRHSYGNQSWSPPGGFIQKNEDATEGLRREIREEVGLVLESIHHMGTFKDSRPHKNVTVHRFVARTNSRKCIIDGLEIREARWFSPEEIEELEIAGDEYLRQAITQNQLL